MTKQTVFSWVIFSFVVVLVGVMLWGRWVVSMYEDSMQPAQQSLVARLQLTDFALWTEARYTRHPSQADFFSAFQDSPGALDHFPAGSMVYPPLGHDDVLPGSGD